MVSAAKFFYTAYQILSILDGRSRQYAMPEVKDVTAAGAVIIKDTLDLGPDLFLGSKENAGIHVALQGLSWSYSPLSLGEVHRPIESDHIASKISQAFECLYALGEDDHRLSVGFQPLAYVADLSQCEDFEIGPGKNAGGWAGTWSKNLHDTWRKSR